MWKSDNPVPKTLVSRKEMLCLYEKGQCKKESQNFSDHIVPYNCSIEYELKSPIRRIFSYLDENESRLIFILLK